MISVKLLGLLTFYLVSNVILCYPSRPLNERSPELTWQAWILVDDQNQNQNARHSSPDGMLRRRITPKSVFIAPTFSPDSLPPCASGYSSDQMGRCIKIIELNKTIHEEFILELLKNKFSTDYDDYEDEETEKPANGPLQVNIPLDYGDVGDEEEDGDTDIAIIVRPTRPDFDFKAFSLDKRDSPGDEAQQELLLKKLVEVTTGKIMETTTIKVEETTTKKVDEITTKNLEETTTEETSSTATTEQNVETVVTSQTESTTEYEEPPTTDTSTTLEDTTTVASTTEGMKMTTTAPPTDSTTATVSAEPTSQTEKVTTVAPKDDFVVFPEGTSRVRFPEDISTPTQIPSSVEFVTNFRISLPLKMADDPVVFREEPTPGKLEPTNGQLNLEVANLDYSNGVQQQQQHVTTTQRPYNRRNRDRSSMFSFPDRWRESYHHKPLVLRFSRKHAYFDSDQFNHPEYYRAIPSDDFAYLFKFKHKNDRR